VVLNINHKPIVLINPMIIHPYHEVTEEKESCLSIPGYSTIVRRLTEIEVVSLNRYGKEQNFEASGLLARCIQHEMDHLRGVLINGK
jgi:peptide deformylase